MIGKSKGIGEFIRKILFINYIEFLDKKHKIDMFYFLYVINGKSNY